MKKIGKYIFIWAFGGVLYYTFEIVFRGFSHWSMYILGGVCFLFIYVQGSSRNWIDPLWIQVGRAMIFVTSMEFITGIIVNKWLNYSVWDYSQMPFQLFGQICLPFILLFSLLSLGGIYLGAYMGYYLFHERKPDFHLL